LAFTVAIIGRPNVGKSTLFNRMVGRRLALVDDLPGVTRDRREGEVKSGDLDFRVIDTAGLEVAGPETLEGRMRQQTEAAIGEADLVLFVMDARVGVTRRISISPRSCAPPAAPLRSWPTRRRVGPPKAVCLTPIRWGSASRSRYRPSTASGCRTSTM
jgi:hypothetical protein